MHTIISSFQKIYLPLPQIEPYNFQLIMKSQFQTLTFLSNYRPNSELDFDMISCFIDKFQKIPPKNLTFSDNPEAATLNSQTFLKWYEEGYGATDIVSYNNSYAILGNCTHDTINVIGTLSEGRIKACNTQATYQEISKTSPEEVESFLLTLTESRLQFNQSTLHLSKKYIPKHQERIIFHSHDLSIKGLGVIESIHNDNSITLFCYFKYPGLNNEQELGYNMHEDNIVNLHGYIFEPMMEDDKRASTLDGVSCSRRLNSELAKVGKVWKDKKKRIEPLNAKVKKGQTYWYISDKLEVIKTVEKDTPTCHHRYLAGNYFIDETAALIMLNKFHQLLRYYLASSKWPKMDND